MFKQLARAFTLALITATAFGSHVAPVSAQSAAVCGVDMKVLVISADGNETGLPAITAALGHIGTPFETYVATQNPGGMTADKLANSCHGFYQAVILTTGNLAYDSGGGNFVSAMTPEEFEVLAAYEARFGVRQVTWYSYPSPDLGFNWPSWPGGAADTSTTPLNARLTTAGAAVFPYLRSGAAAEPIQIKHAYTYLSTAIDNTTTPLLTDDAGNALAALHAYPDGRLNLAMTFDSNPHLTHTLLLSYGVINWVTGGLFIGDRHVYVSPQVDDVFVHDEQWLSTTACGTSVDLTGVSHRITGNDLNAVVAWQKARQLNPISANLRLTMAFNGFGTTAGYLSVGGNDTTTTNSVNTTTNDTLTPTAKTRQSNFNWVSHTYNHTNLDAIEGAAATSELTQNNSVAASMGFSKYSITSLVQPDVSGLYNPAFLLAARDAGVRYLVSDTSRPGQDNPSPNVGFFNPLQPEIFVIPRRANNLFFNVAAPADWVAEYNCMYRGHWGRDLSYAEILDDQSDLLVRFMFRGELDPWMFHQTNLAAYDGTHSLLGDLLDAALDKYSRSMTLPVVSPTMDALGARMANRTLAATYGVQGRAEPGKGVWLTSPVALTVPVTGIKRTGSETYGGQSISWLSLKPNSPMFVAWTETTYTRPPAADAGPSQTVLSTQQATLTGIAADLNAPARSLTYAWTQTSGPAVTLTGADQLVAAFTAPTLPAGSNGVTLGFKLEVSNGLYSVADTTSVIVKLPKAPTASAGASQTVNWSSSVTLNGTGADVNVPAWPITFQWQQTKGPAVAIVNANAAVASFVAPALAVGGSNASLGFSLTVSNGLVSTTALTTVTVVAPKAPTAKASASPTMPQAGAQVSLIGSGADNNTPALPLAFAWTQTGGPTVAIQNATQPQATFTVPPGTARNVSLSFKLVVSNGLGSTTATTSVSVKK